MQFNVPAHLACVHWRSFWCCWGMRIGPELLCHLPVCALTSERAGGDQLPGYCPPGEQVGHPPTHTSKGKALCQFGVSTAIKVPSAPLSCQVLNRTSRVSGYRSLQFCWNCSSHYWRQAHLMDISELWEGPPDRETRTLVMNILELLKCYQKLPMGNSISLLPTALGISYQQYLDHWWTCLLSHFRLFWASAFTNLSQK